jgi:hypothetical protein
MKKIAVMGVAIIFMVITGCSSHWGSAGLGAVGGAVAGVGGYEYHLKKEKEKIEQDYKDGKIDKREYEIRIDQNRRDSPF